MRSTTAELRNQTAELARKLADSGLSGVGTIRLDRVSVSSGIIHVNDEVALVKAGDAWYGVPRLARTVQRVMHYGRNLSYKPIRSGLIAPMRGLTKPELEYLVESGSREVRFWARQELHIMANDPRQYVPLVNQFRRGVFTTQIHVYGCWDRYENQQHPRKASHVRLSTGYTVPMGELLQVVECMFGLRQAYDVRILGYGASQDASGLIKTGCHTWDMSSILAVCWAIGWYAPCMHKDARTRRVANAFKWRAQKLDAEYNAQGGITLPDVE